MKEQFLFVKLEPAEIPGMLQEEWTAAPGPNLAVLEKLVRKDKRRLFHCCAAHTITVSAEKPILRQRYLSGATDQGLL